MNQAFSFIYTCVFDSGVHGTRICLDNSRKSVPFCLRLWVFGFLAGSGRLQLPAREAGLRGRSVVLTLSILFLFHVSSHIS
jgi:hypothetical protein